MDRERPDWDRLSSEELKDFFGNDINVNDRLLKPEVWGRSPILSRCVVTSIVNGKIYLDGSKNPIKFPGRCVNISALRIMN